MNVGNNIFYEPREPNAIELWKNVTQAQWLDAGWQIKNSIRTVDQLKKVISLTPLQEKEIRRTVETLRSQGKDPLRITPYYASLMQADPFHPIIPYDERTRKRLDPIFWQCVPTPANLLFPDTGLEGAMSEGSRSFGAAYQRYPNRVALFVAGNASCASYCVHCQRAKTLDANTGVGLEQIDRGLFYINYNKNIDEVLVTGGDALMIGRELLLYVLEEISRIPHVRVMRIATRVPVVLPMAVNDDLLKAIRSSANKYTHGPEKQVYFITHINHYHEITEYLAAAIRKIRDHGFTVRNQTVLLNHVNDYYQTLAETFRKMFWAGVHPYYLLQCHKEKGIVHFIVPIQVGKIYMKHLQGWLSGVVLPRYAANVEGGGGKVMLVPSGHDTLNTKADIEAKISESFATVKTWDGREINRYEALGRSTPEEFAQAVKIMDDFIGRPGVFLPKVILIDSDGRHIKTTNRTKLPKLERVRKSAKLKYVVHEGDTPLTNPSEIAETLEALYRQERPQRSGFRSLPL